MITAAVADRQGGGERERGRQASQKDEEGCHGWRHWTVVLQSYVQRFMLKFKVTPALLTYSHLLRMNQRKGRGNSSPSSKLLT